MAITNRGDLKARNVKCHVMSDTTASGLETTMNTWFAALDEEVVLEVRFTAVTSLFTALVLYTE